MKYQTQNIKPANRMEAFAPYFFAVRNLRLAELQKDGVNVIRLDVGSPDLPPSDFIIQAMVEHARRPDSHGYQPYGGTQAFRQAVSEYYRRRFGVSLDPQNEVIGLIGSKEGIFHLSQALLDPDDLVLVPEPAYPTYERGGLAAGAHLFPIPLLEENGFLPDLEAIPVGVAKRARLLWLNYPNNPTGAVAELGFFHQTVEFARRFGLLIAHDAPYLEVSFDGYIAPSILQVPGACEVAVEFNSLSKSYNMAGWRLGMAVGNTSALKYLNAYKIQVDSSHFAPLLHAGACALTGDQKWLVARNAIYQARRDIVLDGLRQAGIPAQVPRAALYIWARLPGDIDSLVFCDRILEEIAVSVTPGETYGPNGKGYIRVALCTPTDLIHTAMQRMVDWVKSAW